VQISLIIPAAFPALCFTLQRVDSSQQAQSTRWSKQASIFLYVPVRWRSANAQLPHE